MCPSPNGSVSRILVNISSLDRVKPGLQTRKSLRRDRTFARQVQGGDIKERRSPSPQFADQLNIFDPVDIELVPKRFPLIRDGYAFEGSFTRDAQDSPVGGFRSRRSQSFGSGIA